MLEHLNLLDYWNDQEIQVNILILMNLLGAMLLGLIVGYERAYQGRAAGMRTYALVCMSSCALTIFTGYPNLWFAGHGAINLVSDPTRVIQGIVTGIGFLGAGVIMKEGFSISGLSTAASIWSCSAMGILVGVGFYGASITLAFLLVFSMIIIAKIENKLPQKKALVIMLKFKEGYKPQESKLREAASARGYYIPENSITVSMKNNRQEWHYTAYAQPNKKSLSVTELSNELADYEGIEDFTIANIRH